MNMYMLIYKNFDSGEIITAFAQGETLYQVMKTIPTYKTVSGKHYSLIEVKLDD